MTQQPLRILMTTDAVGGVWVFSTSLAEALTRDGCDVLLVTLGPAPRRDQLEAVTRNGLRVEVTDLALEWMDPEGYDFARARQRLTDIARQFSPDIVHLNSFREGATEWKAPLVLTGHSCVRSWWHACRGGAPDDPRWYPYMEHVRLGLAAADVWVAPSVAFHDTIEALYAPASSGVIVWNGINSAGLVATKKPYILAAGRLWDEAKNVAALSAITDDVAWPIRIAGTPQTEINSVALSTALQWLGELPRADLLREMEQAAIFVAPALYEPFGLAVLEAASAGCALILSDIPTFRELWQDAALFVDAGDPASLRSAINRLCHEPRLREQLQRAASLRARRYSLERTVAEYRRLYHDLLQQTPKSPRRLPRTARPEVYA
jgi:glycosyltransferase involved in cell wall biosynthesis